MPQDIKREDVQTLSNPNAVATFFLELGYDVGTRVVSSAKALGITGDVSFAIKHVERIASLNDGYEISVYLFQLQGRSVTMSAQQAISRAFRNRSGDFLMVLTTQYEQIDFMLVERSDVEAGMTQKEILGPRAPIHRVGGARPRFLTVNRSNPGTAALRVLRLFNYTRGQNVFEHSERLRNAYDVAYWSEEYFNNRALFSDYYLKERLPDERKDWKQPDSSESAKRKRVQGTLRKLYDDAQDEYSNASVLGVRTKLIEPVLAALGFTTQAVKTKKGDERTADYLLYATDTLGRSAGDKPRAVCLAYRWQRDLDRQVDEFEDPETFDENPGAVVVALLDKGAADWAMLTNGKMWRLYAAKAHSRATNYYEIDLEDIVISNVADREEAFKYFWFLFRHDSFLLTEENNTKSLVDALLSASEQYARRLGDRLKNRIFEDVFHHFAQGFVQYAQKQKMLPTNLDSLDAQERERRLKPYFDGTLTFLYRLLFLLYAESRNLLPVHETDSYYQVSLEKLKNDIKERVGESVTDAPSRIRYRYDSTSTTLYDTLQTVFQAVDKGDKDLNVPIYNGGLFMTEPHLLDTSAEAQVAQFLRTHRIPDQYLALGFDLMARDEDDKKSGLVFVDYKSLGVRQLGSIYEGLLEFKLRVATQAMTVVRLEKNKKTEKIVPYAEARAKGLVIVKERHEGAIRERIYNLNDVYLENDRSERKATGSYYTPDYIVKYIVQNTVGPVLNQKLEALRKTFEAAEETLRINKQRNKGLEQQKLKPENAEEKTYQHYERTLNEQFFDLKVLDPAMGSGHFLVEAVDFITDKMTRFLEGFPWNPVVYHLGKIRADIQREMEEQRIAIDVGKLTNINLLKRQVLKRCIYGVDLNPMAVELAKVSVWLDSFTLGAPLSFLDHHLKCGNSLIGARIDNAKQAVEEGQLSLFFGSTMWASVALATGGALEVARMSDSTAEQVLLSKTKFSESEATLTPYKRLLDIYLSREFGNTVIKGKKGSANVDRAIDFLRSHEAEQWYQHPERANILTVEQKKVVDVAQKVEADYRFFHWELEFPEVYFGVVSGTEKVIELKNDGGFDVVVGNPPYGLVTDEQLKSFCQKQFISAQYQTNFYVVFIEQGIKLARNNGFLGLIIPPTYLGMHYFSKLRELILTQTHPQMISKLKFPVFDDATVDSSIIVLQKMDTRNESTLTGQGVVYESLSSFLQQDKSPSLFKVADVLKLENKSFYFLQGGQELNFIQRVQADSSSLADVCEMTTGVKPYQIGKGIPKQTEEVVKNRIFDSSYKLNETYHPYLVGTDIGRYKIAYEVEKWISYGNWLAEPRSSSLFFGAPKILVRRTADNIIAAYDTSSSITLNNIYILKSLLSTLSNLYLISILNSRLATHYHRSLVDDEGRVFAEVKLVDLGKLPMPRITFTTPETERHDYMKGGGNRLYEEGIGKNEGMQALVDFAKLHLEAGRSDVVHDLLAFLAEEMLRLNKDKRDEQQKFLAGMVKRLKVQPDKEGKEGIDVLVGKQRIMEYLGEYQKSTPELGFEELFELLYKNKARMGIPSLEAVKDSLRTEYNESLAIVRPLVKQLQYTDTLIDSVVYALYGLTQDEIDVVEGKR